MCTRSTVTGAINPSAVTSPAPAGMLGFAPRAPRARRWSRQPCSSSGQPRRWPPAGRRLGDDHHCSGRSGHLQQWHHRCDGGSYTKREPAASGRCGGLLCRLSHREGTAAYALLSSRCQQLVGLPKMISLTSAAASLHRALPWTSFTVTSSSGSQATVTYTYAVAKLNQ
jgi:hypothetical protein